MGKYLCFIFIAQIAKEFEYLISGPAPLLKAGNIF
jgi:hypothetical protein